MQKGIFPPQRDPAKGGTTLLVGVIIIITVAVILFGGVFAWQRYAVKSPVNNSEKTDIEGYSAYIKEIKETNSITSEIHIKIGGEDRVIKTQTCCIEGTGCGICPFPCQVKDFSPTKKYVIEDCGTSPARTLNVININTKKEFSFQSGSGYYWSGDDEITSGTCKINIASETKNCGQDTAGWKTYTNSEYGFEISYPQDAVASENNEDLHYWGGEQAIVAKNPVKITQNSNSTTPAVNVFIGTDQKTIENCLKFNFYQPNQQMVQRQEINRTNFYTESQGDAAAGGLRGSITQYSVVINNICYTIQTQISWSDITFVHGATDGKQPTQAELDAQAKAIQGGEGYVLNIAKTFKFTQ